MAAPRVESALALASALQPFWRPGGHDREIRGWLDTALSLADDTHRPRPAPARCWPPPAAHCWPRCGQRWWTLNRPSETQPPRSSSTASSTTRPGSPRASSRSATGRSVSDATGRRAPSLRGPGCRPRLPRRPRDRFGAVAARDRRGGLRRGSLARAGGGRALPSERHDPPHLPAAEHRRLRRDRVRALQRGAAPVGRGAARRASGGRRPASP